MPSQKDNSQNTPPESRDGAAFLYNPQQATAKSKSNLVDIPPITLPKGGGAITGIGEKFSVNSANGNMAFSIPLPLSSGRGGNSPALALNYNSGAGQSAFGLGWAVDFMSIQRRTEKKLPEYQVLQMTASPFLWVGCTT